MYRNDSYDIMAKLAHHRLCKLAGDWVARTVFIAKLSRPSRIQQYVSECMEGQ